jgi:hypothetical protein
MRWRWWRLIDRLAPLTYEGGFRVTLRAHDVLIQMWIDGLDAVGHLLGEVAIP